MACNNCACDPDPTLPLPDKFEEHEKALKMIVSVYEKMNENIININRFLRSKYIHDLVDDAGLPVDCTYWANEVDRVAAQERHVQNMIDELKGKGYLVEKVAPVEPTIENAIRDVVLANTVVK